MTNTQTIFPSFEALVIIDWYYSNVMVASQQEKAAHIQRIRDLEAEAALQAARAEATAAALQALEDQRSAEAAALLEQHKEELTAAHSK